MQTYSDFQPTAFDLKGAFIDGTELNWFVAPVSQTRDSGPLDRSNFQCYLDALGGESDIVQVHRFGHWGPGWFELILIMPCSKAHSTAIELNKALEDYPVVNEEHYSETEYTEAIETWNACYRTSFIDGLPLGDDSRVRYLLHYSDDSQVDLFSYYMDSASNPYFSESDGVCMPEVSEVAEGVQRGTIAIWANQARRLGIKA